LDAFGSTDIEKFRGSCVIFVVRKKQGKRAGSQLYALEMLGSFDSRKNLLADNAKQRQFVGLDQFFDIPGDVVWGVSGSSQKLG
jgi:hypothetical protein